MSERPSNALGRLVSRGGGVSASADTNTDTDSRPGRNWHGALETTVERSIDDLERIRRITVGNTSILVCSDSVRVPVVAVIPSAVAETIVDELVRTDRP